MATIKKGILGPISGSIGQIIGYERLGTPCIRTKGDVKKYSFTLKQKAQQLRVKLANSFINPAKAFINIGFSLSTTGGQTAHNIAMAHAIRTGTKGEFPDLELDFENLLVSDGELGGAMNPRVELLDHVNLQFSWDYDNNLEFSGRKDQVMLLAYSVETKRSFYTIGGAKRSAKADILEIYTDMELEVLETYIAFISEDRKTISRSTYIGKVIVEPLNG
jgi:hypothetical protein